MIYELESIGTTAIIKPKSARLDSVIAPELKSQFIVLSNSDNEYLIVDLDEVTLADSSGISSLLLAYRIYRDSNRGFALCNVHENLHKLMEITQLGKIFSIFPTREDAIKHSTHKGID